MNKPELARRLAEAGETTPALAADRLDEIVFSILKKLRDGKPAAVPGVGRITKGGAGTDAIRRTVKRKAA